MTFKSLINLRNICRMCGERYDEDCKSVDIFQPGPYNGPSYADLMKIHLDLMPRDGDGKPKRIGETCAKLLDEWTDFKKKILETQKELLKMQQRRMLERAAEAARNPPEEVAVGPAENEPSTSRSSARLAVKRKAPCGNEGESSGSKKQAKRPRYKPGKKPNLNLRRKNRHKK